MNASQKSAQHISIPVVEQSRTLAPDPGVLLTPAELAARLAVPQSWVREKTRARACLRDKDPLPVVRLGKYVRFSWPAVEAWIPRQVAGLRRVPHRRRSKPKVKQAPEGEAKPQIGELDSRSKKA